MKAYTYSQLMAKFKQKEKEASDLSRCLYQVCTAPTSKEAKEIIKQVRDLRPPVAKRNLWEKFVSLFKRSAKPSAVKHQ